MITYTLKVIELRRETADTVTVVFKQPGLKKIKYKAGQYLTLIFRINNRKYIRPYSFSSAPGVDVDLEITVKRVPGGVVSNHIADKLAVGDMIEVMQPMGDFVLHEDLLSKDSHIVLWGAGSGITPLMSLVKHSLFNGLAKHVTLVYGNRDFENTIFFEKLNDLQRSKIDTFSVWYFNTQPVVDTQNPYVIQGRINPESVLSVMREEGKLANTKHFICGPAGLKESVKQVLNTLDISNEDIFSEDFELITNPKDFEDVKTGEVCFVKGETQTYIEVAKGKSILEAGLDALIDMSYSCQTGSCLVCKGKLLSGQIKTIGVQQLPKDLGENEYLLCCSYPLTDQVKILI